ncbi:DUF58 domain-containing protein [Paenirhodobacter sp.]|uniref:DUF58 domain-containing protein n=1 Tax=Paenirhodobacter sp. TaxID=1965326 RepID=UPI003B3E5335
MEAEDGRLLDALRGVRWPAQRPPRFAAPGAHRARPPEPSAELSEFRPYRPGEEARCIDWKLLARTDRAFVRLAPGHSRQGTMVLLGAGAGMAWPEATRAKWRQARRLALGLAAVAQQGGDPVGLMLVTGSGDVAQVPAGTHALALRRIARQAAEALPQGRVRLAGALAQCRARRLVVIGDFLDDDADNAALIRGAAQFCAQGREVLAVQVLDDAELNPPRGLSVLRDLHDPGLMRSLDGAARRQYLENLNGWRRSLAQQWRGAGARFLTLRSGADAAAAVRRIAAGQVQDEIAAGGRP